MGNERRALNYDPFEQWGIVMEAILVGGITAPIHTQSQFYAMLKGLPTLVRTDARVKAYASIDLNRLNFIGVQKFIERETGILGVRSCALVFALPPNASWDEYGNREWKWGKSSHLTKASVMHLAKRYSARKGEYRKNSKKCEEGVDNEKSPLV